MSTVPKKLLPLMEKGNGNVGSLKRAALCELFSSWCLNSEADHLTSESVLFGVSSRLFFFAGNIAEDVGEFVACTALRHRVLSRSTETNAVQAFCSQVERHRRVIPGTMVPDPKAHAAAGVPV